MMWPINSESGPKDRNGKNVAFGHLNFPAAMHGARVVAQAIEFVGPAHPATSGVEFEIEIRQSREIKSFNRERRMIMRIIFRKRNVGGPANRSGEQLALHVA